MKHLFIPYPLAVLAKKKGFNEPGLAMFFKNNEEVNFGLSETGDAGKFICSAPIYQQIVDWFREAYKIEISHSPIVDSKYLFIITHQNDSKKNGFVYGNTYYEAYNKIIEQAFKLI